MWDTITSLFGAGKEKAVQTYRSVTGTAQTWAENVVKVGGQYYEDAKVYVSQKKDAVDEKYTEAAVSVWELENNQKIADDLINMLPSGADKVRLQIKRDESRTFFNSYVAPLINKLMNEKKAYERVSFQQINYSNFAAVPVVAVAGATAVVAASSAIIYYAKKNTEMELAIINDPSLSAFQKTQLLSNRGLVPALKVGTPIILVGGAIAAYFYFKGKK